MRLDSLFSKRFLALLLCVVLYGLFFLQKTNLMASDLGRHIANGRIILAEKKVFSTNLYSLTEAERFTPNHHWLFGVIAAVGERAGGFSALTLITAFFYTASVGLMVYSSAQKHRSLWVLAASLLVLPSITVRSEVRPEAFSLFFAGALFLLMERWIHNKISSLHMALFAFLITALWVNIHIFFILSIAILGSFLLQLVATKQFKKLPAYASVCAAAGLGMLVNPLGLTGALYPFRIFTEYEYPVAENQTLFFLLDRFPNMHYYYTAGVIIILGLVLVACLARYRKMCVNNLALITLTFFFGLATLKLIRFENFAALFCIPLFALVFEKTAVEFKKQWQALTEKDVFVMLGSLVSVGVVIAALGSGLFVPFSSGFGLGLYPGSSQAGEFLRTLNVHGPLFNNFDAGSYLIYYLYPQHKVFVDNRAEAYSAEHLQLYKKAQEDEDTWQQLNQQYNFGAIVYYRHENTGWGQKFMVNRVQDAGWVPIFVDDFALILVRAIPEHAEMIQKYKLPANIFQLPDTQ